MDGGLASTPRLGLYQPNSEAYAHEGQRLEMKTKRALGIRLVLNRCHVAVIDFLLFFTLYVGILRNSTEYPSHWHLGLVVASYEQVRDVPPDRLLAFLSTTRRLRLQKRASCTWNGA
jgi:hypothetical protein